jgi:hypothetical protein
VVSSHPPGALPVNPQVDRGFFGFNQFIIIILWHNWRVVDNVFPAEKAL